MPAVVEDVGLKLAVTPLGSPTALNVTLPPNPFMGATAMLLVPLAPRLTASAAGVAEREKSAGGGATATVRLIEAVWLNAALVPVMVTVATPVAAVLEAASVRTLRVTEEAGAKLAVTPLGRPLAVNDTLPANPPTGVTAIALLPLAPRITVRFAGDAERTKSGV
jgi:hypothetical protein